jgi:phytoene/squalene synthetase
LARAVPFQIAHNRLRLPADLMSAAGVTMARLQNDDDREKLKCVVSRIAERAHRHISAAKTASRNINRSAMPVLLWATLAQRVLSAVARRGNDVFDPRVLTYRAATLPLMWRAWRGRI